MACSGCSGNCGSSCTGCSGGCGSNCEGSCSGGCGSNCTGGCSGGCGSSCEGGCSGGCGSNCTSCSGTCSGTCSGGCTGTCEGKCSGSCKGSCKSSCKGSCEGSCSGTCTNACNNGCTGESMTTIYTNLAVKTIITANDIIDLKALVDNETTRRSKTPITAHTITAGNVVIRDMVTDIISNLTTCGTTPTAYTGNIAIQSEIQECIDLVKQLYSMQI